MTKEIMQLEQRYNRLLAEIGKLDAARASGKIRPDDCCFLIAYNQICKARDRLLVQLQKKKTAVTQHEAANGFPRLHGQQLALNFPRAADCP